MDIASSVIVTVIATVVIFVISALPLYFAVRLMGGKTSLLKTVFVTLISGLIVSAVRAKFRIFGALIAFFILIWIYHEVFRLKWLKALIAWVLQFVVIAIFYFIAIALGLALLGASVL